MPELACLRVRERVLTFVHRKAEDGIPEAFRTTSIYLVFLRLKAPHELKYG